MSVEHIFFAAQAETFRELVILDQRGRRRGVEGGSHPQAHPMAVCKVDSASTCIQ